MDTKHCSTVAWVWSSVARTRCGDYRTGDLMLEIGDVLRDIFRALGIPEWEVIGMPVPEDGPDSRVSSGTAGPPSEEPAPEAVTCSQAGEEAQTRRKPRSRRRKVQNSIG